MVTLKPLNFSMYILSASKNICYLLIVTDDIKNYVPFALTYLNAGSRFQNPAKHFWTIIPDAHDLLGPS